LGFEKKKVRSGEMGALVWPSALSSKARRGLRQWVVLGLKGGPGGRNRAPRLGGREKRRLKRESAKQMQCMRAYFCNVGWQKMGQEEGDKIYAAERARECKKARRERAKKIFRELQKKMLTARASGVTYSSCGECAPPVGAASNQREESSTMNPVAFTNWHYCAKETVQSVVAVVRPLVCAKDQAFTAAQEGSLLRGTIEGLNPMDSGSSGP
jgi:hypothetical protein